MVSPLYLLKVMKASKTLSICVENVPRPSLMIIEKKGLILKTWFTL